jgi:hypothetical protein
MSVNKVYDLYAPLLNYKRAIVPLNIPFVSSSWVPPCHRRRLEAYSLLQAYYDCYSRDYRFPPESGDSGNNDDVKEYGTPAWVCDKITNKLLGGNVSINIPLPKRLGNENRLSRLLESDSLDPELKSGIEEQLNSLKQVKDVVSNREAYLQDWFSDSCAYVKIHENEQKASILGDMVYVLEYDEFEKAVNICTYDPAFCFADFDIDEVSLQDGESVVSDRFSIAWEELEDPQSDSDEIRVYRRVYELRKGADNSRRCFMSEAYYTFSSGANVSLWDFNDDMLDSDSVNWVDTGLNFIPAVWIPNIQVQGEVCGKSNIHRLIGLFDSIQNSETDLSKNSEHLGGATAVASGKDAKAKKDATTGFPIPVSIEPAGLYMLGEGGAITLLDTSNMQAALLSTLKHYDDQLVALTELTPVGAGKIDVANIPSGVALTVILQPLLDKIAVMRQQRQTHYSKVFYYVQKLFQLKGTSEQKAIFAGELYDVYLQFGSILPSDRKADAEYYNTLKGTLDAQTILEIAKEDGLQFDIDSVMERKAIEAEAQKQAQLDAFGGQRFIDTGNTDMGNNQNTNQDGQK